ncbi:uncharacterized protein FIBRA_08086 [Fibroporia radiculosa]|uniref:Uncharacterized protein n=1 Tax=Fibroporia radiculosa TaxID=599839 RepID=J4GW65_9APHY|nr:uncharacterized protein FIBRA_08086 [Fibroporia radiculosa]CCM05850.1 predicted protein [Fibroporia radiculosa]
MPRKIVRFDRRTGSIFKKSEYGEIRQRSQTDARDGQEVHVNPLNLSEKVRRSKLSLEAAVGNVQP